MVIGPRRIVLRARAGNTPSSHDRGRKQQLLHGPPPGMRRRLPRCGRNNDLGSQRHWTLMFAALMIGHHLSTSVLCQAASASGVS
jgi:hypothetical protein